MIAIGKQVMRKIVTQFIRFSIVGLLSVALAYIIYKLLLTAQFGSGFSYAIAYGSAMLLSFSLNRKWSFQYNGEYFQTSLRFLIIHASSYLGSIAIQQLMIAIVPSNNYLYEIAFFTAISFSTLINFFGSRFFIYK